MKKLMIVAATVLSGFIANASYLYWQVSPDAGSNWTSASVHYGTTAGTSQGTLDLYYDSTTTIGTSINATAAQGGAFASLAIDNASSMSYWVELVGSDPTSWSGSQYALTYSELTSGNFLVDSLNFAAQSEIAKMSAWTGGTQNAPEPTSGLLTLIGMALLGLRRKRA